MPPLESATLSNGLSVWVVTRRELPYVGLTLALRDAGTSGGVESAELVRVTARAVVEGGTFWQDGLAVDPPSLHGARVQASSQSTFSGYSLRMLSGSLNEGVQLVGRTVRAPAFGRGNLDDVRLHELKRMQDVSSDVSNALWEVTLEAALGEAAAAPYLGKDTQQVRSASVASIERCYGELFRPESSALIAVGDVELSALLPLVERELAAWKGGRPRAKQIVSQPRRILSNSPRVHFLPQRDSGQARVLLLQPAPAAGADADELAFQLMADIAVGALGSRGNISLRHAAGITYGVHPSIISSPELGLLAIEASFEASETVHAVADLQRMLQNLQEKPVAEAELSLAKQASLADLERLAFSNQGLAQYLAFVFAQGLGPNWLAARPAAIAAVTTADIQRVARSYLRPQQLEIAVAGPRALAGELQDLGPVEVYNVRRVAEGTGAED